MYVFVAANYVEIVAQGPLYHELVGRYLNIVDFEWVGSGESWSVFQVMAALMEGCLLIATVPNFVYNIVIIVRESTMDQFFLFGFEDKGYRSLIY